MTPPEQATTPVKAGPSILAHELTDEIMRRRKAALTGQLNRYPRSHPILSDIGDCDRQLVYGVVAWERKPMFDEEVQARLNEGNNQEKKVMEELLALGFDVMLAQQPVEIMGQVAGARVMLARGKIDGFLRHLGIKVPIEIKSMAPQVFNGIKSLEDFQKKPWLRKYLRQLQMYMFGNNCESGIFILTDCLGHWKMLVVDLDLGECERILQRLERAYPIIKKAVELKGEGRPEEEIWAMLPERITYDPSVCGRCDFAHICLPDVITDPATFINTPEWIAKAERVVELRPLAKEFETLWDDFKEAMKNTPKAVIGGRFMAQMLPSSMIKYEIPDDVKKQYAIKVTVRRLSVEIIPGAKP